MIEQIFKKILIYFDRIPKFIIMILSIILTMIIGLIDYFLDFLIGSETSVFILYLIPIFITAWHIGRLSSVFISIISVIVWMLDELITGNYYIYFFKHFFDSIMILGLYIVIIYLIVFIKNELEREKEFASTDFLTGAKNR